MDKTIEIVVVAMVVLVTGLIVLYLVQGQTEGFGDFLGEQKTGAECDLAKTNYQNTCSDNRQELNQIQENAPDDCNFAGIEPEQCR